MFSNTTKTIEAEIIVPVAESSSELVAICGSKRMTLDFGFDQNALDSSVASSSSIVDPPTLATNDPALWND